MDHSQATPAGSGMANMAGHTMSDHLAALRRYHSAVADQL